MENWLKENWFKIGGAILLLVAIGDHPYGYYQLVRWTTAVIATYIAYQSFERKKMFWSSVFAITAIVFNPVVPFYLSKSTWQILDVIAAIIFLISIFVLPKRNHLKG